MASKTLYGVVMVFFVVASTECDDSHGSQFGLPEPQENIMLMENVSYTSINNTVNYQSSTKFNARGMGHLYFLTKMFMDYILDDDPYPPGFIRLTENQTVEFDTENVDKTLQHYTRVIIIVLVAALLASILPFIGLIFCCCRCAGNCGARSEPYDKKYDTCRRHFYAFLLSGVTVLIMFGVVCTFTTNEYVEEGAHALPKNVRISLNDARLYLNNTKREVDTLLIRNFNELNSRLQLLLKRSGEIMQAELKESSSGDFGGNLSAIIEQLKSVRKDLTNIRDLSQDLKVDYDDFTFGLETFKDDIKIKMETCKQERICQEVIDNYIPQFNVNEKFKNLPAFTSDLQDISEFLRGISTEMDLIEQKDYFKNIGFQIQKTVDKVIPDLSRQISNSGNQLMGKADDISKILERANAQLDYVSRRPLEEGEGYLRKYSHYRYYVGLGVSSVLLSILCCLGFGLLCGYCGKRPDHYSDDCCDKGTASRFLMMGVWLMFLTCSGLVAVAVVYFAAGIVADRAVCKALYSPETSPSFALVDQVVNLTTLYENQPPRKLSKIITECHKNLSIYEVLGLRSKSIDVFNVNIVGKVDEVINSIKWDGKVELLSDEVKRNLKSLAGSRVANAANIAETVRQINSEIVRVRMKEIISEIIDKVRKDKSPDSKTKSWVEKTLKVFKDYSVIHENKIEAMKKKMELLKNNGTLFKEHLSVGNHASLKEAIEDLLRRVERAQTSLRENGKETLIKLAKHFGQDLEMHVQNYVDRVRTHMYKDVGRCWPMSRVYNSTVVATCNNILDPFNGFWLSIGWIVVLFLPALILSIKLSTLYQKFEPYPGALAESEYLYDTYADRDSIPLANVPSNPKKKKKKKVNRYESSAGYSSHLGRNERSSRNGVAASAPAPQGEERPWDFAQGGPPQYQSPPMSSEYERPPPYYFPGPNK